MHLHHAHTGALPAAAPLPAARRLANALVTAILVVSLVAAVAVGAALAAGIRPHAEVSDSMRPALRAGDVVWLEHVAAAQVRRGDVVGFAHPDHRRPMLHRVTRVDEQGGRLAFTTRGDANSGAERWSVRRDDRLGRYVGVRVPAVGRVAASAPRHATPALVVLAAFLLLWRVWR